MQVAEPAPFIDLAFTIMQTPARPFDFGLVLHFAPDRTPTLPALLDGARRALKSFPKSQSLLIDRRWCLDPSLGPALDRVNVSGEEACEHAVAEIMSRAIDLRRELGIRQRLVHDTENGTTRLVTQVHHSLCDFVSLMQWLHLQLDAASPLAPEPLALKRHDSAKRKSLYAFGPPCASIRPARRAKPSHVRGFRTLSFAHEEVKAAIKARGEHSYTDLLASICVATLQRWNGAGRIGLWMPVNVRQSPFSGFGNGASRIRIYERTPDASFTARAVHIREQVRWSKTHGEWYAPDLTNAMRRMPAWLGDALFRAYAKRPGVDMATTTFSHIEKLGALADEALLPGVTRLEGVGNLYGGHTLVVGAVAFRAKTYISFTWDAALYAPEDAERFIAMFEEHRARAFSEVHGRV